MLRPLSVVIAIVVFGVGLTGCVAKEVPGTAPRDSTDTHVVYADRTELPPTLGAEQAKAILVARSADIDQLGAGARGFGDIGVVYEVFALPDGWLVFCRRRSFDGRGDDMARTLHIDRAWRPGTISEGPPSPQERSRNIQGGKGGARLNLAPTAGQPPFARPVSCVDRSLIDVGKLSADEAKAIMAARAAGVDYNGGGKGFQIGELTFHVYPVHDGWYVHADGSNLGEGKTVQLDRTFRPKAVSFGPPPSEVTHLADKR